jgi:hypothetical protein
MSVLLKKTNRIFTVFRQRPKIYRIIIHSRGIKK